MNVIFANMKTREISIKIKIALILKIMLLTNYYLLHILN